MKRARSVLLFAIYFGVATGLPAAIIGTNPPAMPLSAARIAALPLEQQAVWMAYLERSTRQLAADRAFLQAERKKHAVKKPVIPSATLNAEGIALDKPADWYGRAGARRIADIIASFQTPAGGWSKNLNLTRSARVPGESFALEDSPRQPGGPDYDLSRITDWNYVGTFDNDATTTQLRFLAKVIAATGTNNASYRAAFQRGLDYIFAAQYPNGGWPQVWPLQGGYHDSITFNDDAMLHVLEFLRDVAGGQNAFAFVPAGARAQAAASLKRGIDCVLATQIVVSGHRTVWCQQHDPLTLQPASARSYEMPAQASSESAAILLFLMQLPALDSNVVAAVNAAAAWFKQTQIQNMAFREVRGRGRLLVSAPGNGPLWARYYEIGTDRPIFGDRDRSIHDDVNEISLERRNGYSWYRDSPKRALERYAQWSWEHP
ncbi:MAG: pectate lyase [Verrucomicrobiota bacterium]